jgi:hypothetical protein
MVFDPVNILWSMSECSRASCRTRSDVPRRDLRLSDRRLQRADELWEKVQAIWSQARSANYAVLEFLQGTGPTRFSPVKPQQWMVASFERHTSPHGLPRPHIHNIVITSFTTGAPTQ